MYKLYTLHGHFDQKSCVTEIPKLVRDVKGSKGSIFSRSLFQEVSMNTVFKRSYL